MWLVSWGIRDNIVFFAGKAPNHIAKITLAIVLFVVTSITAIVRWRNPKLFHSHGKALYVTAYFVSFVLVFVLGFLGGVIVYGF